MAMALMIPPPSTAASSWACRARCQHGSGTPKARLTAGLIHKATRGELALTLPTGLVRTSQGTVHKIPNQEAQARLSLVFETFLQCRSASKVVEVFNTHDLLLPRRNRFGDLVWKAPRVAAVLSILKHPAYAGAFTYGRSRTLRREATQARPSITRLPQEQWRICIPDVYPPSISWETYLQIQTMLKDNHAEYDRNKTRGIRALAKPSCTASSTAGNAATRWSCSIRGHPLHLSLPPPTVSDLCVNILRPIRSIPGSWMRFQALSPVELDVYEQALAKRQQQAERLATAHAQHLARLRYEAAYCERQFHHVDPAHRHVAAELEHAWELALQALKQAEAAEQQRAQASTPPAHALPPALQAAFSAIGQHLPELWPTDVLSQAQRKALLRCLIDKVVIQRARRDQIHTRIVGAVARPRRLRFPWQSEHSPPCRARTRWRNRFGGCLPQAQATMRWPGS